MDFEDGLLAGSTRIDGQSPIEEMGNNWNPMDFVNPHKMRATCSGMWLSLIWYTTTCTI